MDPIVHNDRMTRSMVVTGFDLENTRIYLLNIRAATDICSHGAKCITIRHETIQKKMSKFVLSRSWHHAQLLHARCLSDGVFVSDRKRSRDE